MRRVDPALYTEEYYLKDCSGYGEFKKSKGKSLEPRMEVITRETPSVKGKRVLDVGCGRGELCLWAARNGAKKVVGIDYSREAINLAKKTLSNQPVEIKKRVEFRFVDIKNIKYKSRSFDLIFFIEVYEHLYPEELKIVFTLFSKILTDNGYLVVHTAPNRFFNDYAYRWWCYPVGNIIVSIWNVSKKARYGKMPHWRGIRPKSHLLMHVSEPDYLSFRNLIRQSGFKGKIRSTNITVKKKEISWKDKLFNFFVYLHPFSNYFPLNILWGNDFLSILRKKTIKQV